MENVAGQWVTGGVAATMLQTTLPTVQMWAKQGHIRRENRRCAHAQVKSFWAYSLEDVQAMREELIAKGEIALNPDEFVWLDEDEEWTSVADACRLLNRSATSVDDYCRTRALKRKGQVRFVKPYKRWGTGIEVKSVLEMRAQIFATDPKKGHVEEVVLVAVEKAATATLREYLEDVAKKAVELEVSEEVLVGILSAAYANASKTAEP